MAWQIDSTHSEIQFTVRHMMISKVRGFFESFSGTIDFDLEDKANTAVAVTIDATSINTRETDRDNHLKSPDFLNVDDYPTLTFTSTRVEQTSENTGKLYGDLTIRDETRPVILDVEFAGIAQSPWGTTSAGFSAQTKINRKDWGLTWNAALETGGVLVGEEININIELELVKQEQPQAAAAA